MKNNKRKNFKRKSIQLKCIQKDFVWKGDCIDDIEEYQIRENDSVIKTRISLRGLLQEPVEEVYDEPFAVEISPKDLEGAPKIKNISVRLVEKKMLEDADEVIQKKGKEQRAINEVLDYIIKLVEIELIDDRFCYYQVPIWKPIESAMTLSRITYGRLECHASLDTKQFKELFNALEGRKYQMDNIDTDKYRNSKYICFRNGVYDIENDEMLQHSSKYYFFSYLDYDFIPGEIGEGEVFDKYLYSISEGNFAIEQRILQIIGYCCSDLPNTKKIPVFLGLRDSGKTTLANLIHTIVGKNNGEAISLEHVNRFSAANLYGKKIGICSDLSGKQISSTAAEELKLLTGGDVVRAERKGKDAFSFTPICKIIIASNFRPKLADRDEALEERWVVVPFTKSISEDEKNPNLLREIVNEDVMQHVFYLIFDALREFINDGYKFADIRELEDYDPNDDSFFINTFFEERCIYEEGTKLSKTVFYDEYIGFCRERAIQPLSQKVFSREFGKLMEEKNFKEDRNDFRGYRHLGLL